LPEAESLDVRRAEDFEWWLQDFKRKTRRSYNDAEMSKVITRVRALPSSKNTIGLASLGYNDKDDNNTKFPKAVASSRFKQHNIKTWVSGTAKKYLLNEVEDAVIDELIHD
jgi:hypothetical protein